MSSKIKVDQIENTSGSGDVAFTGTGGIKLDTIKSSGGISAMTIDSSGRVLNPGRIAFQAGFTNNDNVNVGNSDNTDYRIDFTDTIYNFGNCWNGTNTFTAPVTGMYMFYGNLYGLRNSDTTKVGISLYENGSVKHKNYNAAHENETTASITMALYLTATKTVDLRMSTYDSNGTSDTFQFNRHTVSSNFGGHLIG